MILAKFYQKFLPNLQNFAQLGPNKRTVFFYSSPASKFAP